MRTILLILIFFGLQIGLVHSQDVADLVSRKFDDYRHKYVQEKIYVSTDRDLYLTGELMWFSVLSVDATSHKPSDISKVVYVEILNRNNEPVAQAKVQLVEGVGSGSFFMPTSLASDNYVLRAYTNWMKNFEPDYYFHKTVGVINPFVVPESNNKEKPTVNISMYPEGGDLLYSVESKIAFRIYSEGDLSTMRAFVMCDNDTLVRLKPSANGLGSFEFLPSINRNYQIVISSKDGVSKHPFPSIQHQGYTLRLVEKGESIELIVQKIDAGFTTNENLLLFAHTRNDAVKTEVGKMVNRQIIFHIPKNELHEGVTHFSIFNYEGRPVCQRLYFKEPDLKKLEVKVSEAALGSRTRNLLEIISQAQAEYLSVSASKMDSLAFSLNPTFADYLWLYSELGANSQFLPNGAKIPASRVEIDNLILTQPWKRFSWNDILKDTIPIEHLPETGGHIIKAKITDFESRPKQNVLAHLSIPGKVIHMNTSLSNKNGTLSFEMRNFFDKHKLLLTPNVKFDSTSLIKIQNPFSTEYATYSLPELQMKASEERNLLERSVRMQAQNIFFEEFESQFLTPSIDSLPFYGKAEETYRLDDYTRFPLMEEVMREYVKGVVVRKRKDGFNFSVLDKKHNSLFRDMPLILLDGVPIFDADEIMQFDPLKVKQLDVVTAKYFHGNLEFPGIVSYQTYNGDLGGFSVRSKNAMIDYEGLQIPRKFYSPTYSSSNAESRIPDPRYLLYWNPSVSVKANQKTEIEFFTSDVPGTYLVKVEGITKDGQVVQGTTTFVVKDR